MEFDPVSEQDLLREMRHVRRKLKRHRLMWGLLFWAALTAAAGWFVFNRYYALAIAQGPGMEDTVMSGSVALCRRLEGEAPAVGDVILFSKDGQTHLKRVIAQGGDQLILSLNGNLSINGEKWAGSMKGITDGSDMLYHPVTVPEGEFFVMGEQYGLSVDSRSSAFGTVSQAQVIGRMEAALWPPYQLAEPFQKYVWQPIKQHVVDPVLKLFK